MRALLFAFMMLFCGMEGHALIIRHIVITGNKRTRSAIILRELQIAEGSTVTDTSAFVRNAKERLVNLSLFTVVNAGLRNFGADSADVYIDVRERWFIYPKPLFQLADRNFNVWWVEQHHDLRRINAGLTITDNNFRGNAEKLSATVQAGYTQKLGLDYTRPYIDRRQQQGIGCSVAVSQNGELAYATDSNKLLFARLPGSHIIRAFDAAVIYTYRPGYAVKHSIQLEYHNIAVSDTVLRLNADYFGSRNDRAQYAGITYRLDLNFTDNFSYPLRGFKMVAYALARKSIDNSFLQAQLRTEAGIFNNPFPKWHIAAIFRGRLSFPNNEPYYFSGALGNKTEYVRGYEYYVIDGSHYCVFRLDLKREVYNKTFTSLPFRYLPALQLKLYPKLFFDAGYVHNTQPGNSFLHDKMLYSYGAGLDIVTAYDIKIRIEAARNALGQNGLFLHLNSE